MTAVEHERWGPNGVAVEQIVRRAQKLTADEVRRLASAWDAWTAPDPADGPLDFGDTDPGQVASDEWNEAEEALDDASAIAGRVRLLRRVRRAAWAAVRTGRTGWGWHEAAYAAEVAAEVAACRDLVGTSGYTEEHAALLLGPWRAVFGAEVEPVCECGEG